MTNKDFSSLGLLNIHKELTDKIRLAEVSNELVSKEFISLNDIKLFIFIFIYIKRFIFANLSGFIYG